MAGRCGCGSSVCSCLLQQGDGITITGTGSPSNPYVITAVGGDTITVTDTPSVDLTLTGLGVLSADVIISPDAGNQLVENANGLFVPASCTEVSLTIAAIVALETAGTLDPCTQYIVTDWVSGTGSLPGPNFLYVRALEPNRLSEEVLVRTPIATLGPERGTFLWAFGIMTYLADGVGNEIFDFGFGTIDTFPWGNLTWTGNVLQNVTFTGGFAVTSAAVAAGFAFANNKTGPQGGVIIDLTGVVAGSMSGNLLDGVTVTTGTGGSLFQVSGSQFHSAGGVMEVTHGSTGDLVIQSSKFHGGRYVTVNAGGLTIEGCEFGGITNPGAHEMDITASDTGAGAVGMLFQTCRGNNLVATSTTAGGARAQIVGCEFDDAALSFTGGANPGQGRVVNSSLIRGDSSLVVDASASTVAGNAVSFTTVDNDSTLNAHAQGSIARSRVSGNGVLSTGAFAHDVVIIDGQFTTTLTAANTNTLQNKGFSDVV